MTTKEKIAWDKIKQWLKDFNNDKEPWKTTPASDLLTLIWKAELKKRGE